MDDQAPLYTKAHEKKLLLKLMQPPSFKGEVVNVEKDAKAWIEAMDDYFLACWHDRIKSSHARNVLID